MKPRIEKISNIYKFFLGGDGVKPKKTIAGLLLLAMLVTSVISLFPLGVSAAEPSYNASTQYKKSRYYENLQKIPLSGDQAADTIAIALSQLGYHEGNSDADLGGLNTSGTRDFVEYNVLYGKLDNNQGNGVSYGYYWCASFVNWCLRQARVSKTASATGEVSCQRWLAACKSAEIYTEKSGYSPKAGDLIFFKDTGSYVSSTHMGIVLYSDGSRVYTVEGNTSDGSFSSNGNYVALKSYSLTSSYIVGYATPKYEKNEKVLPVDYSGKHMSTGLYVAKKNIQYFDNPELKGEGKQLSAYSVFTVTEIYKNAFRIICESGGKKIEGWASLGDKAQQLTSDSQAYTVSYLDESGATLLPLQYRLADSKIILSEARPTKKNAGFLGWTREKGSQAELIAPGAMLSAEKNDLVLYAVWDYTFYLVTFKDADGSVISQKYGYYGDVFEVPAPTNVPEGMVFAGWDGDVSGVILGDASYTAIYRERSESDTEVKSPSGEETEDKSVPVGGTGLQNGCRSTVSCELVLLMLLTGAFAVPAFKKKDD